jgi:hypothetical protein
MQTNVGEMGCIEYEYELLPIGGFFAHFDLAGLNLRPVAVAYAKIEFSPAEESGNQGCQIRGILP